MKTTFFTALSLMVLLIASCGNGAVAEAKFSKEEMKTQEAAWAEMMEYHDIVMEKMQHFYPLTKGLEGLAKETMVEASDTHPKAGMAIENLEKAEDGMMEWMQGIGANPIDSVRAQYDHTGVLSFIDKELNNIEAVNTAMDAAIKEANELLGY